MIVDSVHTNLRACLRLTCNFSIWSCEKRSSSKDPAIGELLGETHGIEGNYCRFIPEPPQVEAQAEVPSTPRAFQTDCAKSASRTSDAATLTLVFGTPMSSSSLAWGGNAYVGGNVRGGVYSPYLLQ